MMKNERKEELFEVLCGTYEEFLIGYKFYKDDEKYELEQSIADHSHRSSIRSVAAFKHRFASGGADENIHLYDLRERREGGLLMHHSGTVNALQFTPDGTHLMSGGDDGAIALVRVGNWALEKIWTKAHKGLAVHGLSIHPSGKLALSVGADKTLRTWNLIKGRPAYTVNLANKCVKPEIISWSICGSYFGLINDKNFDIYSVESAAIEKVINSDDKITCLTFLEDNKVCLGDWAGNVTCYRFLTGEKDWKIESSGPRIKSVAHKGDWIIVANGEGKIIIYDIKDSPKKVCEINTSCRITCMAVTHVDHESTEKKKKKKKLEKKKEEEKEKEKEGEKEETQIICSQKWTVTDT